MPRAAKIDREATRLAKFLDARSFRSLDGHDYLKGKDITLRRREVFARDYGKCQVCLRNGRSNHIGRQEGEMHHVQGGLVGRHDDLENLEWVCRFHHRMSHVQVRWTPKNSLK